MFEEGFVSRRHARLFVLGERWMIEDLDAAHGTHLDGHRLVDVEPLVDGSVITIGRHGSDEQLRIDVIDTHGETTESDPNTACPASEGGATPGVSRPVIVAGVIGLIVVALVIFRSMTGNGSDAAPLAVTVVTTEGGATVETALGAVVSTDQALVLVPTSRDRAPGRSYTVIVEIPDQPPIEAAAFAVAEGERFTILGLIGVDGSPALSTHLETSGTFGLRIGDLAQADSLLLGVGPNGNAITEPVAVSESSVGSESGAGPVQTLLLDDSDIVGFATDGCRDREGSTSYLASGLGGVQEAIDGVPAIRSVTGPAPIQLRISAPIAGAAKPADAPSQVIRSMSSGRPGATADPPYEVTRTTTPSTVNWVPTARVTRRPGGTWWSTPRASVKSNGSDVSFRSPSTVAVVRVDLHRAEHRVEVVVASCVMVRERCPRRGDERRRRKNENEVGAQRVAATGAAVRHLAPFGPVRSTTHEAALTSGSHVSQHVAPLGVDHPSPHIEEPLGERTGEQRSKSRGIRRPQWLDVSMKLGMRTVRIIRWVEAEPRLEAEMPQVGLGVGEADLGHHALERMMHHQQVEQHHRQGETVGVLRRVGLPAHDLRCHELLRPEDVRRPDAVDADVVIVTDEGRAAVGIEERIAEVDVAVAQPSRV